MAPPREPHWAEGAAKTSDAREWRQSDLALSGPGTRVMSGCSLAGGRGSGVDNTFDAAGFEPSPLEVVNDSALGVREGGKPKAKPSVVVQGAAHNASSAAI